MATCSQRGDCPQHVRQSQEKALASTIFILRNIGPLGFLLKDESGTVSKVLIGNPHVCSCSCFQKERDLCSHICWILIKRFKLAKNDPVSFQLGLTDRDIDKLLRMSGPQPQDAPKIIKKLKTVQTQDDDDEEEEDTGHLKKQKPLTDEDVCPICQENFIEKHWPITFCRYGCGNNIHIQCMKVWADHQITREDDALVKSDKGMMVQCPYCRGQFCSLNQLKREYFHDPTRKVKWKKEAPPEPKQESPRATAKKKNQDELRELLQNDSKEELTSNPSVDKMMRRIPSTKIPAGSRLVLDGLQCCLCLQRFQTGDRIGRLLCRHRFHRLCLVQWFSNNRAVCPIDKLPAYELDPSEKNNGKKLPAVTTPTFVLCGLSMAGTKEEGTNTEANNTTKIEEPVRRRAGDSIPSWVSKKERERKQHLASLQSSKDTGGGLAGGNQKPSRKRWELGNSLAPSFVVMNSLGRGTDTIPGKTLVRRKKC